MAVVVPGLLNTSKYRAELTEINFDVELQSNNNNNKLTFQTHN